MKDFVTGIRQTMADWCETRVHRSKSIKWEIFWGNLGYRILGLK